MSGGKNERIDGDDSQQSPSSNDENEVQAGDKKSPPFEESASPYYFFVALVPAAYRDERGFVKYSVKDILEKRFEGIFSVGEALMDFSSVDEAVDFFADFGIDAGLIREYHQLVTDSHSDGRPILKHNALVVNFFSSPAFFVDCPQAQADARRTLLGMFGRETVYKALRSFDTEDDAVEFFNKVGIKEKWTRKYFQGQQSIEDHLSCIGIIAL